MISHARRGAGALAALAAIVTVCAACTVLQPRSPAPAHPHPRATRTRQAVASLTALLPVSPAQLEAAALAARFAATYDTHRAGEPASAWLARLAPMATSQLTGALTRTATTPAAGVGTAESGQTVSEHIRDLTAMSVIFAVQVRETITSAAGRRTGTGTLAVTVTSQNSGGWAVYDIEPAAAGDTGGAGGATPGQ